MKRVKKCFYYMANDEEELNLISSILFQINHRTGKRLCSAEEGEKVILSFCRVTVMCNFTLDLSQKEEFKCRNKTSNRILWQTFNLKSKFSCQNWSKTLSTL